MEDAFEGVVVTTFHPPSAPAAPQGSQRLTLQGHHLSSECGHNFVHCQNLLKDSFLVNGVQRTIVFVPLVEGIALIGLSRDSAAHYHIQLHTILQTIGPPVEISCSPSTMFKVLDSYFAVCTNQTTNFVSVFEVLLNTSSLSNTLITFPANQITIPPFVGSIVNASNFVHVEIDRNHEYIIFAVGTVMYSMRPFLYASGPLGNDIPSATCERVSALVYRQGSELYAFCSEHLFTYDIGEEDWLVQDTFARRGIPYHCPRQETDLSVFADYIQYRIDGLVETVEIEGDSYSSGVCFGNSTRSYFAFRDKGAGVFVLHLQNSELVSVSTSSCQHDCYPLNAVDNRYLILREDVSRRVLVLDYLGQRLRLIEALHTSAALATVVELACPPAEEDIVTTATMEPVFTTGRTNDLTTATMEPTGRASDDTTASTEGVVSTANDHNKSTATTAGPAVSIQPRDEAEYTSRENKIEKVVIVAPVGAVVGVIAIGIGILLVALVYCKVLRDKPKTG